jgi:hypothetical protein
MEAGHLGAYFAARGKDEIDAALAMLAKAPAMLAIDAWLDAAFEVRAQFPVSPEEAARCPSVAMPTWLYGHEPPNAFATHVAKYFDNSVREEGVLAIGLYGGSTRRAAPGPSRRSSRTQRRTITPPTDLRAPWCSWARATPLDLRSAPPGLSEWALGHRGA